MSKSPQQPPGTLKSAPVIPPREQRPRYLQPLQPHPGTLQDLHPADSWLAHLSPFNWPFGQHTHQGLLRGWPRVSGALHWGPGSPATSEDQEDRREMKEGTKGRGFLVGPYFNPNQPPHHLNIYTFFTSLFSCYPSPPQKKKQLTLEPTWV